MTPAHYPAPPIHRTMQPVGDGKGRTSRRWRILAANVRARHDPCWICGQAIDYTLDVTDLMAFTVDHYHPRSTHPALAEDPGNLRAAHAKCNKARGNTPAENMAGLGRTSVNWETISSDL